MRFIQPAWSNIFSVSFSSLLFLDLGVSCWLLIHGIENRCSSRLRPHGRGRNRIPAGSQRHFSEFSHIQTVPVDNCFVHCFWDFQLNPELFHKSFQT